MMKLGGSVPSVVGIIDVGRGNARSVALALRRVTSRVEVVTNAREIPNCDALVLPGVGNFGTFKKHLEFGGFSRQTMMTFISQRPLLGICVGMQYLSTGSEESPSRMGLGVFACLTLKLRRLGVNQLRVPHVGWGAVDPSHIDRPPGWMSSVWGRDFYFMHSYAVPHLAADVVGTTTYESQFAAIVHRGHVTGVQFHPERSQDAGSDFLSSWVSSI